MVETQALSDNKQQAEEGYVRRESRIITGGGYLVDYGDDSLSEYEDEDDAIEDEGDVYKDDPFYAAIGYTPTSRDEKENELDIEIDEGRSEDYDPEDPEDLDQIMDEVERLFPEDAADCEGGDVEGEVPDVTDPNTSIGLVTTLGELVSRYDPRLKPARKVWRRHREEGVYMTVSGELAYTAYSGEHNAYRHYLFTPKTEAEKELVRMVDDMLHEAEKNTRAQYQRIDFKHSLDETERERMARNEAYIHSHTVVAEDNSEPIRPEAILVERLKGKKLTDEQEKVYFNIYSARELQKDIAERESVTPQAICNRNSRIKATVKRGMEEYGSTEGNYRDYEKQMVMLGDRVASISEGTAAEYFAKYQEAKLTVEILKEWKDVYDESLCSGYREMEGNRTANDILRGREAAVDQIGRIQMLIAKMDAALTKVMGSLSDDRYVTVLRKRDMAGRGMDEAARAVGLGRRGAEKLRKRALEEAEEAYQEVRYA